MKKKAKTYWANCISVADPFGSIDPEYPPGIFDEADRDETTNLIKQRLPHKQITFQLTYPFEKGYTKTIKSKNGVSFKQIIKAVSSGYRHMFKGSTSKSMKNILNESA